MALTVEDGTGLASANSYISLADARAILAAVGQDLDTVDATAEQQLITALEFVESYRAKLKGAKLTREQALQYPRTGAYIDGWLLPMDEVPNEIKRAQTFAAYEVAQGNVLLATTTGQKVQSEEVVGAVKKSYFQNSAVSGIKQYPRVMAELKSLIKSGLELRRT